MGLREGYGSSKASIWAKNLFLFWILFSRGSLLWARLNLIQVLRFTDKKGQRFYLRLLLHHHNILCLLPPREQWLLSTFLTRKGQSEPRSGINIVGAMLTVRWRDRPPGSSSSLFLLRADSLPFSPDACRWRGHQRSCCSNRYSAVKQLLRGPFELTGARMLELMWWAKVMSTPAHDEVPSLDWRGHEQASGWEKFQNKGYLTRFWNPSLKLEESGKNLNWFSHFTSEEIEA